MSTIAPRWGLLWRESSDQWNCVGLYDTRQEAIDAFDLWAHVEDGRLVLVALEETETKDIAHATEKTWGCDICRRMWRASEGRPCLPDVEPCGARELACDYTGWEDALGYQRSTGFAPPAEAREQR